MARSRCIYVVLPNDGGKYVLGVFTVKHEMLTELRVNGFRKEWVTVHRHHDGLLTEGVDITAQLDWGIP